MIDAGGHNVFEPLSWGKAIIVGPHTQNFTAEVDYLISKQAISIVETEKALYESWQKLAHDRVFRERLEACAREANSALPDRVGDYAALINQAVKARG
jgi:3-deoxy-D-manno-octulosonic-acid transferase